MKDGHYISIISKSDEDTDINFDALCTRLPGINVVNGLPGNEILIRCSEGQSIYVYSLNQICEALERSVRVDMFELVTDTKTKEQYRVWYCLPPKATNT